jgi:hypothetical protein
MLNGLTLVCISLVSFILIRSFRQNRAKLPRVGRAGPIGYVWTVLRSVFDSDGLVADGWYKFGGQPFILPSMTGEWIVLGPEYVESLRKTDDTVVGASACALQSRVDSNFLRSSMPRFGTSRSDL